MLPLRTKTGACLTVTDHILPRILHLRMDVNASTGGSLSPMILHFSVAAVQLTSTSCPNCSPVLVRPCLLLQVCNLSTTGTTFALNVTPILPLYWFVAWLRLWGTPVSTGPRGPPLRLVCIRGYADTGVFSINQPFKTSLFPFQLNYYCRFCCDAIN